MSEGKGAMVGDRIELRFDMVENKLSRLEGLFEQLDRRVLAVENKLSRLEGLFDQMDRRVSSLEQLQRQGLGIMMGTWVSLMLAVLGLYFKG
ncbi:MAG: hypothetical protein HYW07_13290 [Candidatus Latescibacteria bacterium]|nr:hypothetical protein [Candidatus Latescibacterota bacterium]